MSDFSGAPTRGQSRQLEAVRNSSGTFDIDAYHVMEARDDALIAQEILYGSGSTKFVYSFEVAGKLTTGISVIGARHLAAHYGGIKHRLIASVTKIGSLFTFTSYPQPDVPMHVDVQVIDLLEKQDDYYEVLAELTDVKVGNSIQIRKRESAEERKRDGSKFSRPHYSVIAEAKAYRNGVLALIDQAVQLKWKESMLALNKNEVITESVVEEKRASVLRFAASKSVPIDRNRLELLTMEQVAGLGDAGREGGLERFRSAAQSLGLLPSVVHQMAATSASATQSGAQAAAQAGSKPAASTVERDATTASAANVATATPQFEGYIADEWGEVAPGPNGSDSYRSAASYVGALIALLGKSDNIEALLENNADGIEDAREADPVAAHLFDESLAKLMNSLAPAKSNAAADVALPLAIPTNNGRIDLQAYLSAALADLSKFTTSAALTAWVTTNKPTIDTLPTTTKKAAHKAIADRADAIKAAASSDDSEDAQMELAAGLMQDITATKTLAELRALDGLRGFTIRLEKLNPALKTNVIAGMKKHRDELSDAEARSGK